jgi:hypothetical protein
VNAAVHFCTAAHFLVNPLKSSVLVSLLPQESWDLDLIVKLIAKQWLSLRDRFRAWFWPLIPLLFACSRLWTTKNVKAIEA